ncbi:hypothetical protein MMC26_004230 [Xylographa opegraphella]|nr:hypothetical protein [Xylographa opegraphella]
MATMTNGIPVSAMAEATVLPYTYGLNGVDVPVDNLSSKGLFTSIAIVFLAILVIRLVQAGVAHLRHLTSMSESSAGLEKYWSQDGGSYWSTAKRDLLYAPLGNRRHNRELQLSKAINVGTIPSRFDTLLLGLYFASNIVYTLLLDYSVIDKAAVWAEIRGRTGHLSVVNAVLVFVFAGRNNPLISIFGLSFDTFNLFHRWGGRIVIIEALVHTIAWGVNEHAAKGWEGINAAFATSSFIQFGLIGTVALLIILFQSPSAIRHAFYETFLHCHQVLAFFALLGIFYHAKLGLLPQLQYVIANICIWSYDRLLRWARILYRNVSLRQGLTKVIVEALPGEACRVTCFLPRPWSYNPGMHAYIYLPAVSLWMSHPFSIAWSSTRGYHPADEKLPTSTADFALPSRPCNSLSFVIAKRSGMTASLYALAASTPSRTIQISGLVEGPYGPAHSLHSYGTVLLFAGGAGITHQLGHVRALLAAYAAGTTAARRITLVWTVRSTEQLEWVRPWMDEILGMPGRREALHVLLFITKPNETYEIRSASERVKMFPGRPRPQWLVEEAWRKRVGAMTVGVCGPGAFADDVRAAVRGLEGGGVVDFWEEAFTW